MSHHTVKMRQIIIICFLVAASLTGQTSALANHGDNGSSMADRDNNDQGRKGYYLTVAGQEACDWGTNRLDATEITMQDNDPSDIRCYDGYYDASWFGLTTCITPDNTAGRCDVYTVQFDLSDYGHADGSLYVGWYQYIGCHEFGHTSSVGHQPDQTNSCMDNGSGNRFFNGHDGDAINADY